MERKFSLQKQEIDRKRLLVSGGWKLKEGVSLTKK